MPAHQMGSNAAPSHFGHGAATSASAVALVRPDHCRLLPWLTEAGGRRWLLKFLRIADPALGLCSKLINWELRLLFPVVTGEMRAVFTSPHPLPGIHDRCAAHPHGH